MGKREDNATSVRVAIARATLHSPRRRSAPTNPAVPQRIDLHHLWGTSVTTHAFRVFARPAHAPSQVPRPRRGRVGDGRSQLDGILHLAGKLFLRAGSAPQQQRRPPHATPRRAWHDPRRRQARQDRDLRGDVPRPDAPGEGRRAPADRADRRLGRGGNQSAHARLSRFADVTRGQCADAHSSGAAFHPTNTTSRATIRRGLTSIIRTATGSPPISSSRA